MERSFSKLAEEEEELSAPEGRQIDIHHQRGVFLVVILVVMGNNIKGGTISSSLCFAFSFAFGPVHEDMGHVITNLFLIRFLLLVLALGFLVH